MPILIVRIIKMLNIGRAGKKWRVNTLPASSGAIHPQRFDQRETVICEMNRSWSISTSRMDDIPILIKEYWGVNEMCVQSMSETRNESMVGIVTMRIVFVKATLIVLSAIFSPHFLFPAPVGAIDQALCA